MARVMIAMNDGDPAPLVEWVKAASASPAPAASQASGSPPRAAEARRRMLAALSAYGEAHPDVPWPYYAAGRLLQAEGDHATAGAMLQHFQKLCGSGQRRQQAARLGILPGSASGAS
jgi:hypothetical protein